MIPVYFHGIPGHRDEVALAGVAPHFFTPETQAAPDTHLISFSLGAQRALDFAARYGAARIDLIAPAAPLQSGDFIGKMAGAPVFRAAQRGTLTRLTKTQAVLARVAPRLLTEIILSGAPPADKDFFARRAARNQLSNLLRQSLIENQAAYLEAVNAYVQDWQSLLRQVRCPVTLWHGTADTWAPFEMSKALNTALPNATLVPLPDLGHYSALADVLPRLIPKQSSSQSY